MTFTLTFSHIQDGKRVPLIVDDVEVSLIVEAESKTATYEDPKVKTLCETTGNNCRVRRVN